MVTDEDLKKYSETWIQIVTVFLAVEMAGLVFLYESNTTQIAKGLPLAVFGIGIIGTTGMSLISFLAVRDPRTTFPISRGINIGISLIACNVGVGITGLYLNDLLFLKGDPTLATTLYVIELALLIFFFPILYKKYIRMHDSKR